MKNWVIVCMLFPLSLWAQTDSIAVEPKGTDVVASENEPYEHSPRKAAIYAAALPGLGHIYNKKYWKLPLVYGAVGTSIGFIIYNTRLYNEYFDAYLTRVDEDPTNDLLFFPGVPDQALLSEVETIRTWVEWSYIALLGSYILQVVDATVDAHFYHFNVSDDLTARITPSLQWQNRTQLAHGLTLTLTF